MRLREWVYRARRPGKPHGYRPGGVRATSRITAVAGVAALVAAAAVAGNDAASTVKRPPAQPQISPMGAIARGDVPRPYYSELVGKGAPPRATPAAPLGLQGADRLVHSPVAAGFQSETTVAVNGPFVVAGFNDIRGFGSTVSVSGYAYSGDGGVTWNDGGQLPLLTGTDQVYGDPDVKTWTDPGDGTIYFFYSSIYTTSSGNNSLCLHVSTDGGATWSTPREVTSATSASDFCDKEFMGVDAETGRIFISWTNFGTSTTMRVTYTDDFGLTWSPATVFSSSGQGSVPRPDPGSPAVYIVWRSGGDIKFVASPDNGGTWGSILTAATGLIDPESPYGSDRIHGFPSMDVDGATGVAHIVYASQNLGDFSDIYYVQAAAGGSSFSNPVAINSNPGSDRGQFFPWVSVEQNSGRVDVVWYDQIRGTGTADLTDVFLAQSHDGGLNWSCPTAISDRTFHAEYGNNTSQPNIGDYIQCASQNAQTYVAFAKTDEPAYGTYAPDTYVDVSDDAIGAAPIHLPPGVYADLFTGFVDYGCRPTNGYLESGEFADLTVTLWEYANCGPTTGIQGTLSLLNPGAGATIVDGTAAFGDLSGLGSTSANLDPLTIALDSLFVCGDPIDLVLHLTSSAGDARIIFRVPTGEPSALPLLAEDFDTVSAPALPSGWATTPISGATNPWVTSTTFAATPPNAAFCADIGSVSLNRLVSPTINVPADCDLLEVHFQITHDLENAGAGTRMAWDGALLKVMIGGSSTYLAGAFSYDFEPFYPNQLYRMSGSGANPLQDLAVWSGDVTPGFSDVALRFPGLAGQQVQLLWEVGTDGAVGTATGMFVDNVDVASLTFDCPSCVPTAVAEQPARAPLAITSVAPNPFNPQTTVRFTVPERLAVTAEVWSVAGERVRTLARARVFEPGEHALRWNGRNDRGETVASGVYFVRLETRVGETVARAVLLK